MLVLLAAQEEEWDDLASAVNRFQQVNMALKYARKPVVAAPSAARSAAVAEFQCIARASSSQPKPTWAWSRRRRSDSRRRRLQGNDPAPGRRTPGVRADRIRQSFFERRGKAASSASHYRRPAFR